MATQHGPFSLHTMFEGLSLHKMAVPTPMVRPLDDSQGPSPCHGHGLWLVCEVGLSTSHANMVHSEELVGVICIQQ